MDLSALKRDSALLMAVLGRDKPGPHLRCPYHQDAHGSMSVWQDQSGVWFWKCMAGCGSGTVIDAAMRSWHLASPAEAVRRLEGELGVKVGRDEEYQEPRVDQVRAERLLRDAHGLLMSDPGIQEHLLLGRRGITIEAAQRYRLGFALGVRFREWRSWRLTGWVIPITGPGGELLAVKIHQEGRREAKSPKCLWAPLGTYPPAKPKHGTQTLWPPPEDWQTPDRLYLCPGELKALALVGAGYAATSPTTGEGGKFPAKLVERIRKVAPRFVVVTYDGDGAGEKWRDSVAEALTAAGLSVTAYEYTSPAAIDCPGEPISPAGGIAPTEEEEPREGQETGQETPAEQPVRVRELPERLKYAGDRVPRDPSAPCPECGGTEFWPAFGWKGGEVCAKCIPPPPVENRA